VEDRLPRDENTGQSEYETDYNGDSQQGAAGGFGHG
jgi:hypothetical protein